MILAQCDSNQRSEYGILDGVHETYFRPSLAHILLVPSVALLLLSDTYLIYITWLLPFAGPSSWSSTRLKE